MMEPHQLMDVRRGSELSKYPDVEETQNYFNIPIKIVPANEKSLQIKNGEITFAI